MSWTEPRIATLKKLWLDGLSASQCARQLGGGVTRNACIAKIHRLGLAGRVQAAKPVLKAPAVRRAPSQNNGLNVRPHRPQPVMAAPPPPPVFRPEPTIQDGLLLTSRRFGQCSWVIGRDDEGEAVCCGRDTGAIKKSFCFEHGAVAYQPSKPETTRRLQRLVGVDKRVTERQYEERLVGIDGRLV